MGISMGCRFRSEIVLVAAALGAAAFCAPAAAQADGEIQFNEKFLGLISGALDQDVIQFEEAGGSKLTVTVTSQPGNQLKPSLALLDGSLAEIDVGGKLQLGQKEARIEGFAAPYSGTYYVRVGSANGLTGTYTCQVKGKVKKEYKAT
ncbi:MAG: PPC domain-containing protein, partial [Planctomycetes bacterium]|nr:PPC domain-containing protein [Planctomycetota bacterium]